MSGPEPAFDQVNLVVGEMEAAVEFYRLLGVDVADTRPDWMPHHRTVASAGAGLVVDFDSSVFASHWGGRWSPDRTGVVVGLRYPARADVDRIYEAVIEAGGVGLREPHDAFWGARYALVEDPDGTAIGLMSVADEAACRPPPDIDSFS